MHTLFAVINELGPSLPRQGRDYMRYVSDNGSLDSSCDGLEYFAKFQLEYQKKGQRQEGHSEENLVLALGARAPTMYVQ